jgi:hypothetical protein
MKKTILTLSVIFQLLYTPCFASHSPESPSEPEKKTPHTLNCSGPGKDWNDCYQQADMVCPAGYKIIKKSTGIIAAPVNGATTLVPSKKLVFECK